MELLVLIPLTGFILFWHRWQQASIASSALHTLSAIIVVLFAAGMLGALPAGRWLLLGAGLVLLIIELARHRQTSLTALQSVPMIMLMALSVAYFLIHGQSEFRYYDEFSHWGIYLKDMVANGGFWHADSNTMHPRYPPGAPLWQYFFVFADAPREGTAYFGQFLLLLIPLLVLFERLSWRQAAWAVGITVLILFGYGNFGHGIASLYIDHVISAMIAGVFLNFMADLRSRSNSQMITYVLPLTAMALIKDSCFFFAIALAGMFFVMLLVRSLRRQGPPLGQRVITTLPALALLLSLPVLVTIAWSFERDAVGAKEDVMSVTGLVGILTGATTVDDPERAEAVRILFPHVFINQQLSKNIISDLENAFTTDTMTRFTDPFRLTTASFLLLFVLWSGLTIWLIIHPPDRVYWAIGFSGLLAVSLAYILMLYLSYHYVFPRHDALYIASYIRYVHSVTLPLLLVGLAPLLPVFSEAQISKESGARKAKLTARSPVIFTFALLALLLAERPHIQTLLPGSPKNLTDFRDYIRDTATVLRNTVGESKLWMYLPDNDTHHFMSRVMLFELAPTPTTVNRDFEFFAQSNDEILAEWAQYDYVWIAFQDAEVDERLREIAGNDLGDRLYRVTKAGDSYRIENVRPDSPAE